MDDIPNTTDLLSLVRDADEQVILQRLEEIDGERDALKTLLRSIRARNRALQSRQTANEETSRA